GMFKSKPHHKNTFFRLVKSMIDERAPEAAKPCVPARHFSKQIDLTNSIKPIILLISDLFQPLI
ncbi:hypothetical protein, partial [uncultured Duncaniella sp.]|uniref:hypothetical protein n=1 Tax=uncultured Duncaniella sp. TaxID=2768039 RepID=UPI00265B5D92